MDDKEFDALAKRFESSVKPGGAPPTVPPGADAVDITEYLRLAKQGRQLLTRANASGNASAASRIKVYLDELKRVARARAMQRELARLEQKPDPYVTPFPALDPHLQSARFGR